MVVPYATDEPLRIKRVFEGYEHCLLKYSIFLTNETEKRRYFLPIVSLYERMTCDQSKLDIPVGIHVIHCEQSVASPSFIAQQIECT